MVIFEYRKYDLVSIYKDIQYLIAEVDFVIGVYQACLIRKTRLTLTWPEEPAFQYCNKKHHYLKKIPGRQTITSLNENRRGCLGCHVLQDIEDKYVFSLIQEWETRIIHKKG